MSVLSPAEPEAASPTEAAANAASGSAGALPQSQLATKQSAVASIAANPQTRPKRRLAVSVAGVLVVGAVVAVGRWQVNAHATNAARDTAPNAPANLSHVLNSKTASVSTSARNEQPASHASASLIGKTPISTPSTRKADTGSASHPAANGAAASVPPAPAPLPASPATSKGDNAPAAASLSKAELEAMLRTQQEQSAIIKSLERDVIAAKNGRAPAKQAAAPPKGSTAPAAGHDSGANAFLQQPALPSVADESKPRPVLRLKAVRVNPQDNKAIHLSLHNGSDCYAGFYLLSPQQGAAVRVFPGYEFFAAAPKAGYALNLPLSNGFSSRGAVLIVAAPKELKNLPPSFDLPLPPPIPMPPDATREQRQQIVRQNSQQFSEQIALILAESHALVGGQGIQPRDIMVRLVGGNPLVSGRNPNGGGRRIGQSGIPRLRPRRSLPPNGELEP